MLVKNHWFRVALLLAFVCAVLTAYFAHNKGWQKRASNVSPTGSSEERERGLPADMPGTRKVVDVEKDGLSIDARRGRVLWGETDEVLNMDGQLTLVMANGERAIEVNDGIWRLDGDAEPPLFAYGIRLGGESFWPLVAQIPEVGGEYVLRVDQNPRVAFRVFSEGDEMGQFVIKALKYGGLSKGSMDESDLSQVENVLTLQSPAYVDYKQLTDVLIVTADGMEQTLVDTPLPGYGVCSVELGLGCDLTVEFIGDGVPGVGLLVSGPLGETLRTVTLEGADRVRFFGLPEVEAKVEVVQGLGSHGQMPAQLRSHGVSLNPGENYLKVGPLDSVSTTGSLNLLVLLSSNSAVRPEGQVVATFTPIETWRNSASRRLNGRISIGLDRIPSDGLTLQKGPIILPVGSYRVTILGLGLSEEFEIVPNGSEVVEIVQPPLTEISLEVVDESNQELIPIEMLVVSPSHEGSGPSGVTPFIRPMNPGTVTCASGVVDLMIDLGPSYELINQSFSLAPGADHLRFQAKRLVQVELWLFDSEGQPVEVPREVLRKVEGRSSEGKRVVRTRILEERKVPFNSRSQNGVDVSGGFLMGASFAIVGRGVGISLSGAGEYLIDFPDIMGFAPVPTIRLDVMEPSSGGPTVHRVLLER